MVDLLRGYPPALAWAAGSGSIPLDLPGLVAMELLQGCRNLAEQRQLEKKLLGFTLHWPTQADCQRAFQDFAAFRLSQGLGLIDALIGQTAVGIGEPLATFNIKHYAFITGLSIVQPY